VGQAVSALVIAITTLTRSRSLVGATSTTWNSFSPNNKAVKSYMLVVSLSESGKRSSACRGHEPQLRHDTPGRSKSPQTCQTQAVYTSNLEDDTVSVIVTANGTVISFVPVGDKPGSSVALPHESAVQVVSLDDDKMSVIGQPEP
jgi:YVTN family beta-propeller protein